ncbi:hypothetical protein Bca52824_022999 [Brassica carinata]|uniref:Leucine-rich repeat-containing N-terminal plant-type domain-containing protein n=1 Tax=Brassica carinata TaxID=52824 RepID=A0A8X8AV51_BRACI|nr:hypothetical protein Bca52824_022999 [Brassica carinata]
MIQDDPNSILSTWTPRKCPCQFSGVTCLAGRVSETNLSGSGLSGTVSFNAFTSLNALSVLKLSENILLTEDLFLGTKKLQTLDLSYNNITGSISGLTIPLSSCGSWSSIDLSGNGISGFVPVPLTNCTKLKSLNLSHNNFDGQIPKSLGELKTLQSLDLSHNRLTGWIPLEIGEACGSLQNLWISYNGTGVIPDSLSACSWIQTLDLSNNNISSPFPDKILRSFGSLQILLLSENSYPVCFRQRSLIELSIPDNLVTGEITMTISQCFELGTIDLSRNYLNGSMPPEIGNLQKLERFIAWYNNLAGTIPPEKIIEEKMSRKEEISYLFIVEHHRLSQP